MKEGKEEGGPSAEAAPVACDYCGKPAERVTGEIIYPHRPDLFHKRFYACRPCGAFVGCHANSGKPFGRLANAELRKAKMAAHAAFDPIWQAGDIARRDAYAWLSEALSITRDDCHIGMMDLDGCRAVVDACASRAPSQSPSPSTPRGPHGK